MSQPPNESFVLVHLVGQAPAVRQQSGLGPTFCLHPILNKLMLCDGDRRTSPCVSRVLLDFKVKRSTLLLRSHWLHAASGGTDIAAARTSRVPRITNQLTGSSVDFLLLLLHSSSLPWNSKPEPEYCCCLNLLSPELFF